MTKAKFTLNEAEKSYCKDTAARLTRAEETFVELLIEISGIAKVQAEKVLTFYRKNKMVKVDAYMGRITPKHGAYLDRDVILRAVNL